MSEPVIRRRTPIEAPPPYPTEVGRQRWPNGSGIFVPPVKLDTRTSVERQLGWSVTHGKGEVKVYARTGPGDDDLVYKGLCPKLDFAKIMALLGPLWSLTWKKR